MKNNTHTKLTISFKEPTTTEFIEKLVDGIQAVAEAYDLSIDLVFENSSMRYWSFDYKPTPLPTPSIDSILLEKKINQANKPGFSLGGKADLSVG